MTRAELWWYFLKLGSIGFGGPLALIAHIQKDLVEEKKLLSDTEFQQALALIKSLPGPVAVQTVAFIAYRCLGLWSAIMSVLLFILPASVLMCILAAQYTQMKTLPAVPEILLGMQSAALVLIAGSLHPLAKTHLKKMKFWLLLLLSLILLIFLKVPEPLCILGAGFISLMLNKIEFSNNKTLFSFPMIELLLVCLKAGGFAFGTGLAIIPMLSHDFVEHYQWISQQEFLDALAFGQMTPGPISVTVTFVGYRIAGLPGAIIATFGIFFPGVFNMTTWFPRMFDWLSQQKGIQHFLVGAIAAICAGIILALLTMVKEADGLILVLSILLFGASLKWKWPSWLYVLLCGGLSLFLKIGIK